MTHRLAIVGAGIGGLAAADHLRRRADALGREVEVAIFEGADRAGGVLATESCEGALLERGPDTLVTHKPAGLALCERLGFADRIVYPESGHIEILDRGRLLPLPAGFAFLAPTRWKPLLETPLLSWRGKLRALAEPLLGPKRSAADESVASFVRRRFGGELYARLSEPVVGGITMADVETLSLAANFPRLASLEHEPGRVSGGWRKRPAPGGSKDRPGPGAGKKPLPPQIATLSGGLGQIVDALVEALPPGVLRKNRPVVAVRRGGTGFHLDLSGGDTYLADAVLLAVPAHAAAPLVAGLSAPLSDDLRKISYASCVTVNLGWHRDAVARPPRGHGFFVPSAAGLPVVAATFVSVKFPERVPADQIVARIFLGGALHPEAADRSDEDLLNLAQRTVGPLLGLRRPAAWSRVWRHPLAIPQRSVGYLDVVERLKQGLADQPGLEFAGGPFGAYGLPDSISAGEGAAERLLEWTRGT